MDKNDGTSPKENVTESNEPLTSEGQTVQRPIEDENEARNSREENNFGNIQDNDLQPKKIQVVDKDKDESENEEQQETNNTQDDISKESSSSIGRLSINDDEILNLLNEIEAQNEKVEGMQSQLISMWEVENKTASDIKVLKELQTTLLQESLKLKKMIEKAFELQQLNTIRNQRNSSDDDNQQKYFKP